MTVTTDFPSVLREWRKKSGLTQRALAQRLGITRTAIAGYEQARNLCSSEIGAKLVELGFPAEYLVCGKHYVKTAKKALSDEERAFAEENHRLVYRYLQFKQLSFEDWYDVVIFGYLHAVKLWFDRINLHKYSFSTIAYRCMRSEVCSEREKQKRRPEYRAVSFDDIIPGTDSVTYGDILCDPRDCVGI